MTLALLTCGLLLQALTPEVIEHAQAGAAAEKQGRLDVAIQEFRKVTELQPNSAAGHANLGNVYFKNGDYADAVPELKRALELNPKLMGTHQTLGVAFLVQGNAAAALPHLELTRTPELLGLAYLETGRLGSAVVALQAALERQPNDPDLLYYFGRATGLASRRTASQLLRIDPLAASRCSAEANPDSERSRSPQEVVAGVLSLQKALAERPDDPTLLCNFSRSAAKASQNAIDQSLHTDPRSARSHQIMAERCVESGHFPDAEREYEESLRLNPNAPGVHLALGNVLAKEENIAGALEQFRMEAQLRPESAEVLYRLGYLLLEQGQVKSAAAALTQANQVQPGNPQILMALSKAALAAHDTSGAENALTKLLEVDKTSDLAAEAHFELAALYRQAGKIQEADRQLAAYEKLKDRGPHADAQP